MTEQEFRDALKRQVGQTGLSSDRQAQVLAGMKGGESKVRTWNKMKIALVMAALVVLSVGAAVAGSSRGVNWAGEVIEVRPLVLAAQSEQELAVDRFADAAREDGDVVYFWQIHEDGKKKLAWYEGGSSTYADSMTEMQAWIEAAALLPWPQWLPDGYTMDTGRVGLACKWPGTHVLRHRATFEDSYDVMWISIPEEYRFVNNYTLRLENEDGKILQIHVNMANRGDEKILRISDDASAEKISIEGMSDALLVDSKTSKVLTARRYLGRNLQYTKFWGFLEPDDQLRLSEQMGLYDSLVLEVNTTDADLSVDALLAIFGLTTQ